MSCSVEDCDRPVQARGWCHKHYMHWHTYGTPAKLPALTLEERLQERIADGPLFEGTPCWEWQGQCLKSGYGYISIDNKKQYTHRVAWELWRGPIPSGHHVDHRCENKACCNPAHLEPVLPVENTRRAFAKVTHCPKGHSYDGGARRCKVCDRERHRARHAEKIEAA